MSGRGILDADMRTLAHLAVEGWRWWTTELRALVPERLRGLGRRAWPRMRYADGALSLEPGAAAPPPGASISVLLPRTLFLVRRIERPAVNPRDLSRMLALEGERLLPFTGDGAIVAGQVAGPGSSPERIAVDVAGMAADAGRQVAEAVAASGFAASQVLAEGIGQDCAPIDFAPAMRDLGILARPRSAAPCLWLVVGLLVALNLAAVVWRDMASVARIERIVAEQQPAVAIAQQIERRVAASRGLAVRTAVLRQRQDALGTLATVSRILPEGVWLERYVWDGATVRLSGYRPKAIDVATALRGSRRFADVQSTTDEMKAALPGGEPFDITARVRSR